MPKPTTAIVFKVENESKVFAFAGCEDLKVRQVWGDEQVITIGIPKGQGWAKKLFDVARHLNPGLETTLRKKHFQEFEKGQKSNREYEQSKRVNTTPAAIKKR